MDTRTPPVEPERVFALETHETVEGDRRTCSRSRARSRKIFEITQLDRVTRIVGTREEAIALAPSDPA